METAFRIKKYIEDNGLKQTFIAEKAGIDAGVFNAIMNGRTRLTVDRLQLIAKALDKPPEFFLS